MWKTDVASVSKKTEKNLDLNDFQWWFTTTSKMVWFLKNFFQKKSVWKTKKQLKISYIDNLQ